MQMDKSNSPNKIHFNIKKKIPSQWTLEGASQFRDYQVWLRKTFQLIFSVFHVTYMSTILSSECIFLL